MSSFATLLCTEDELCNVLTLQKYMRNVGSSYPLLCLVLETVAPQVQKMLEEHDIRVVSIKDMDKQWHSVHPYLLERKERTPGILNKLYLWSLTDYNCLVYVDNDAMVIENIDHLFALPPGFYAAGGYLTDTISTELMILKPNYDLYLQLVKEDMNNIGFDTGCDAGLINHVFMQQWSKNGRLHQGYNCHAYILPNASYIHVLLNQHKLHVIFFGRKTPKPWLQTREAFLEGKQDYELSYHDKRWQSLHSTWLWITNK